MFPRILNNSMGDGIKNWLSQQLSFKIKWPTLVHVAWWLGHVSMPQKPLTKHRNQPKVNMPNSGNYLDWTPILERT